MGASPSGWVAPPYYPAPLSFASWCCIRMATPAVNYNNLYSVRYVESPVPGVPSDEVRFLLKFASPVAAGTRIRGIVPRNSTYALTVLDPAVPISAVGLFMLDTINANFNPAVDTWATISGISTTLIRSQNLNVIPGAAGGSMAFEWSAILSALLNGFTLGAISYGMQLRVSVTDAAGNGPSIYDSANPFPAVDINIPNWQLHLNP